MTGFVGQIEDVTVENTYFRRVVYTGKYCQLVVMSLRAGEDIGMEAHPRVDQFFRFEQGTGKVVINGAQHQVSDGDAVIVPAGAEHNVVNTSEVEDLKLYTIYSPPNHPDGTIHKSRAEAMEHEHQ